MLVLFLFFFFNDPATTEIYTLSLHDALPIWSFPGRLVVRPSAAPSVVTFLDLDLTITRPLPDVALDRKSTRLNSSHVEISYAVFCLKKKKKTKTRSHISH